jgi:hypothetical protein
MIIAHLFGAGVIGPRPKTVKQSHDQQEFELTTLTQEGSFIPLLIGRRRIGHFVGWAGDRASIPVSTRVSTKGSRKKKVQGTPVWVEAAWHLLCVGPAWKLHKVYQDGKVIWEGPVQRDTTPSGTALQTIAGEEFRIYWGEEDQPVNTFLGDGDRVGVSSRWPFHCYVVWTNKSLGNAPRWPMIEYDVEVLPTLGAPLSDCAPAGALETVFAETADAPVRAGECRVTKNGTTGVQNGSSSVVFNLPTAGYYKIHQDNGAGQDITFTLNHVPGTRSAAATWDVIRLSLDGTPLYEWLNAGVIDASPPDDCLNYSNPGGASGRSWVFDEAELEDQVFYLASGNHTLLLETTVTEDGSAADNNHIAIADLWFKRVEAVEPTPLTQLLFAPWPHGLGLDRDAFDLASFVTLQELLDDEGLTDLSVYAPNGMEALTAIAGLLQDLGVVLSLDVAAGGKFAVRALRQADATASVPAALLTSRPPELENVQGDRPATRLIYTFPDVDREHRESTVTIDHDGAAGHLAVHRARKLSLFTVTDLASASAVAERRSQEEIAGQARYVFTMNRGARLLVPGQRISVPGITDVLRVLEVGADQASGECQVTATPDFYGAQAATYVAPAGGDGSSSGVPPLEDLAAQIVEVPAELLAGAPPSIVVPRIRAHDQVIFADMHLSGDDTTYHLVDREGALQTGGELLDAIAADDPYEIEEGPTFTLLGPDADLIEDFTADEASWRSGRQLAVIGDEWFFLRNVTAIGGAVYRLDGLIRARFDSARAAHSVGAKVFIFAFDEILDMTDPLVAPDQLLYVKPQPWTSSPLSLASITAVSKTLYGKGLRPPPVNALRVTLPRNGVPAYYTGEDVRFAWGYLSTEPGVGADRVPAGTPTADAAIDGEFEVEIYDAGDVLVRTETVATPVFLYDNATLQADLGGETDFTISVRHTKNGYRSSAVELAVEAL